MEYKQEYIIILVILVNREEIDNHLQEMKQEGGYNTRYISFRNSKSDIRLGELYINSLYIIPIKYEYIENVDLLEKLTY